MRAPCRFKWQVIGIAVVTGVLEMTCTLIGVHANFEFQFIGATLTY